MSPASRLLVIVLTALVVLGMCVFPPWREWKLVSNQPDAEVTELACYAPFFAPPPSLGFRQGYEVNRSLLSVQVLAVILAGAAIAFGKRGAIGVVLPVAAFLLGGYLPYAAFVPKTAQEGWVFPVHFLLMGFGALCGAVAGIAASAAIIRSMPSPKDPRE